MPRTVYEKASRGLLGGFYRLELAWAIVLHGGQKAFTNAEIRGLMDPSRRGDRGTTLRDLEGFAEAGVLTAEGEKGDGRMWRVVQCEFWAYCERLRAELDSGIVSPP